MTELLLGVEVDLKEVLPYTNLKESDVKSLAINDKSVAKAVDVLSFRNINPRKVPYIAPTISPGWVSSNPDFLEHPTEIFAEYRNAGLRYIIGEKKHMGSRATIYMFKDKETALEYTGEDETIYAISRGGYDFFVDDAETKAWFQKEMKAFLDGSDYFNKNDIKFAIWDAEILPWNLKAGKLLAKEYIPALEASHTLYNGIVNILEDSQLEVPIRKELKTYINETLNNISDYQEELENYCWNTEDKNAIKIAPFHLLATDKGTFFNKKHEEHLKHFENAYNRFPTALITLTDYRIIDLEDEESCDKAVEWWLDLVDEGYEGVIFKSEYFTQENATPMLKCRGKEYLRIIYGINYDMPDQLAKHKCRRTSRKRKLHYNETLLGILSLNKFVQKEDTHDLVLLHFLRYEFGYF